MNAAAWERAKSLLAEAADLPAEDRARFVVEHCSDPALRREVLDMLASPAPLSEIITAGALAPGDYLGPYVIERMLGRGGMGIVYRARDTRLDRTVAIKVLPPEVSADPARRQRFDREARAIAALDDPHICTLYDVSQDNALDFLVMQYLEGETLAARLARGRLPLDEVLRFAGDIAAALDRAHRVGVIHRDLKPANIMLTKAGAVLLDFGLARLTPTKAGSLTTEPTASRALTGEGTLIGTLHYMAPEQLEGREADTRSDIFAFGAVMYEMATGRKAFDGDSQASVLGAVLKDQPPSITRHEPATPAQLDRLVRTCLAKHPDERFQNLHDVVIALHWIQDAADPSVRGVAGDRQAPSASRPWWPWLATLAAGLGVVLLLLWGRAATRAPSPEVRHVSMELGTDASLVRIRYGHGYAIILSPDGRALAFVAQASEGAPSQIYVRSLDQLRAVPLSGTENAINPFFSPDGQWIGFFADGKLKKVPAAGGGAVTICTVLNNRGGAWGENGTIVFSPDRERASLWQVPSSGGDAKPLIPLAEGETTQRWPQLLRGGAAVLFTSNSRPDGFEQADVVVQVLPNGPRKAVVRGAYFGRYLTSGHLLYAHNGTVFAAAFDLDRLELSGPPVPVLQGATVTMSSGGAEIAVSNTRTVAYLPAPEHADNGYAGLDWMDRNGRTTPLRATPMRWLNPRFAPDGRRLAFDDFDGVQHDIWIYEWSRDELTRLTFDPAEDSFPVWTPDARRIVFASTRRSAISPNAPPWMNLYWQRSDGTGQVQRLTEGARVHWPTSWHPNGRILALGEADLEARTQSIMMLSLEGDEASGWRPAHPTMFLKDADHGMFSPDGQWLAYVARKTPGAIFGYDPRPDAEVFVRPFPGPGGPWQISAGGGTDPVWSLKRHELLFGTPDHRIMAASYSASGASFHAEKPHALSDARFDPRVGGRSFDLHPDGERFVLAKATDAQRTNRAHHVTMVFNFLDELQKRAPAGK